MADLRYILRGLRASPGFTATAILTLAIGIGVNAAVFTVINSVLFKGFPLVRGNDRLLYMTTFDGCCVSYPDYKDWAAQAESFDGMGITHGIAVEYVDGGGFPERLEATEVSSNTFRLTGQQPVLGRDFDAADDAPGAAPTAILNYGFWDRRYAKDPAAIGRVVRINGVATTIVGVMPQGYSFPQKVDVWVPLIPTPSVLNRNNRNTWFAFGRLRDGVTMEAARAELLTISKRLEAEYPETNKDLPPHVYTFGSFFIGDAAAQTYYALWGAVGFVLLIACANLANLLLARAAGRSREVSLRIALGAGRWRIVRQLLIESITLSFAGGVAAWWIAKAGVRFWAMSGGESLSGNILGGWFDDVLDFSMDARVFFYMIAISIATGVLFGLVPALRISRLDVNAALKDGGRGTSLGRRGSRLSSLLVAGEMALAIMLLAGAGMMIRSFLNATKGDMGFDRENLLIALVQLPESRYPDANSRNNFHERLQEQLNAIPGVRSAATDQSPPGWFGNVYGTEVEDTPSADPDSRPMIETKTIGPAYFKTLEVPIVAGREFNDSDRASGIPAAIVSQKFAARFWPGQDPIGKRLRSYIGATPTEWRTVMGVVPDIGRNGESGQSEAAVYTSYAQRPGSGTWIVARTAIPPETLSDAVRKTVREMDSDLPIGLGPEPLTRRLAGVHQYRAAMAGIFALFAAIALLMAAIGLYAVVANSIARRTQEMGVRIALGATARDILKLVLRQGMLPMLAGLGIGLMGSMAVYRVLQSVLVQVPVNDPVTLAASVAVLTTASALGCLIPARRAMRVDPVVALREE